MRVTSGPAFAGRRVGLLGGSFNPAHEGHRAISLYALKRLGLDEIWWLVSPQNPLKTHAGMASLPARLASAQSASAHPRIRVTAIEADLGTCFTIDTLRALRRHFPRTHFVWLMGSDNARQVGRWKKWDALFRTVPVAVFRRPAYAAGRKCGKAAQRFDAGWRSLNGARQLAATMPPAWLVLDNPLHAISATRIRKDHPSWPKQRNPQAKNRSPKKPR